MHPISSSKQRGGRLARALSIQPGEGRVVLALCAMKCLLSIFYSMMKLHENTNFAMAKEAGIERMPFVKTVHFPFMILLILLYTACLNRFALTRILYGILGFLFVGFALFSCYLGPHQHELLIDVTPWLRYVSAYPYLTQIVYIFQAWVLTCFYSLTQIVSQFGIVIFFWTIANELCDGNMAKRLYPTIIGVGFFGAIIGSQLYSYLGHMTTTELTLEQRSIQCAMLTTWIARVGLLCTTLLLLLFTWLCRTYLNPRKTLSTFRRVEQPHAARSLWKSFRHITSSGSLRWLTLTIISLTICDRLFDETFRKYLADSSYGDSVAKFAGMEAKKLTYSILITFVVCFFIAPRIMKRWGWGKTAYVMPTIVTMLGLLYFPLSIFHSNERLAHFLQTTLARNAKDLVVQVGFYKSIIFTGLRYSFFDITKESIFATMNSEERQKGKAAIDVIASRTGRYIAALIHALSIAFFATDIGGHTTIDEKAKDIRTISDVIFYCFLFTIVLWLYSIFALSRRKQVKQQQSATHTGHKPSSQRISLTA